MGLTKGVVAAALIVCATTGQAEYKSPKIRRAESVLKMIIGLNHYRCAEVVYVEKVQGSVYGVTCIRTAGRSARVRYAVDAANNAVVSVGW